MAEKFPLVLGDEVPLEELQDGDTLAVGDYSLPASVGSDNQSLVVNGSSLGFETQDHGELAGLNDDDHSQYHNDTRGDARYYTETELDAGQLDNRYFTEAEHINSSAGAGDSGKPIKLDAGGHVDATMINDGDIDHGSIAGLSDDDHSQYHNDSRAAAWLASNHETTYSHANYDTAYGWGNHASAGYLTSESDTLDDVVGRNGTTASGVTVGNLTDSALTSGRIVYAGASGILSDSASLTFDGTDITIASGSDIIITDNTATEMLYAGSSKEIKSSSKMTFDGTDFTVASGSAIVSADTLRLYTTGTGAVQFSSGGNTRGNYAVDLQLARGSVDEVASGNYSFGAGRSNTASGAYAVAAGYNNDATGFGSIALGYGNDSSSDYAYAIGKNNAAEQPDSIAMGEDSCASRYGEVSYAAGKLSDVGDAQQSFLVSRNQTTDATATELFLNGSNARLIISSGMTWHFTVKVVAKETNNDNSVAAYTIEGIISRAGAAAAVLVDSTTIYSYEDDAAWDFTVSAESSYLKLTVTGDTGNNINWVASTHLVQVVE